MMQVNQHRESYQSTESNVRQEVKVSMAQVDQHGESNQPKGSNVRKEAKKC